MPSIIQTHNINDFSGGEGSGFYYGPTGSYRVGQNLENRQLENGLMISKAKVDTGITYLGEILSVNPYEDRCFSTEVSNNGKIYKSGVFKLDLTSATSAWNKIVAWGRMTKVDNVNYYYGISKTSFGEGSIFRFDTAFTSSTSVGTFTMGLGRTTGVTITPSISTELGIIWGAGNTIFSISTDEIITDKLILPKDCDIMSITKYQDRFKVFYNWGRDGFIGYWDGETGSLSSTVKYEGSKILFVTNDGPYDYVVFGDIYTTDLYYVGGLNRGNPIVVNTEGSSNGNGRAFIEDGFIREGIFYCIGKNKFGNKCLYSYGNYYPGSNNSLTPMFLIGDYSKFLPEPQFLYVYDSGKIYTHSYFFDNDPDSQGIVITYPIIGQEGIGTEKTIEFIDIAYHLGGVSNSIVIYARGNGSPYSKNDTGWKLIKTITGEDHNAKKGIKILKNEMQSAGLGTFFQLEYKILLNFVSGNGPILHYINTTYFDEI